MNKYLEQFFLKYLQEQQEQLDDPRDDDPVTDDVDAHLVKYFPSLAKTMTPEELDTHLQTITSSEILRGRDTRTEIQHLLNKKNHTKEHHDVILPYAFRHLSFIDVLHNPSIPIEQRFSHAIRHMDQTTDQHEREFNLEDFIQAYHHEKYNRWQKDKENLSLDKTKKLSEIAFSLNGTMMPTQPLPQDNSYVSPVRTMRHVHPINYHLFKIDSNTPQIEYLMHKDHDNFSILPHLNRFLREAHELDREENRAYLLPEGHPDRFDKFSLGVEGWEHGTNVPEHRRRTKDIISKDFMSFADGNSPSFTRWLFKMFNGSSLTGREPITHPLPTYQVQRNMGYLMLKNQLAKMKAYTLANNKKDREEAKRKILEEPLQITEDDVRKMLKRTNNFGVGLKVSRYSGRTSYGGERGSGPEVIMGYYPNDGVESRGQQMLLPYQPRTGMEAHHILEFVGLDIDQYNKKAKELSELSGMDAARTQTIEHRFLAKEGFAHGMFDHSQRGVYYSPNPYKPKYFSFDDFMKKSVLTKHFLPR